MTIASAGGTDEGHEAGPASGSEESPDAGDSRGAGDSSDAGDRPDDVGGPPADGSGRGGGRHPRRKPRNLAQISARSWAYVFRRTVYEFFTDRCPDLAAALTYYTVLAVFPALLAVVSIVGVFGQEQATVDAIVGFVRGSAPGQTAALLEQPLTALASSDAAGVTFVVGILGALWSASGYVRAFSRALNQIYEVKEGRPIWKLFPLLLLVTLVILLLAASLMIMLIVSGPIARGIGEFFGLGDVVVLTWNIAKWPVMVAFAVIIIAVLYFATPNVKPPKFRWLSMGAFVSLLLMSAVTTGFGIYVSNFGSYNATYGVIGGVIVLLLWMWLVNLALLFGVEFDAETERGRELQAGIKAERHVNRPPRDTRQIVKARRKEAKQILRGRRLRLRR